MIHLVIVERNVDIIFCIWHVQTVTTALKWKCGEVRMSSCFACGVCMTHASSSLVIGWSSECFVKTSNWSFCDSPTRHPSSTPSCHHHTELAMLVSHWFSKKSKSIHS
jgi:hypothetical protein